MLGGFIAGFITILVGVTLLPTIANEVQIAKCNDGRLFNITGTGTDDFQFCNVSGASSTLLGLVTLFFAIGVLGVGVALVTDGLKSAGMM